MQIQHGIFFSGAGMDNYRDFADKLKTIINEEMVLLNEPMKNHTNFRLGGPADILVMPSTREEYRQTVKLAMNENIPCFIIGNGSNLLVRDGGIRGLVVKLEKIDDIAVDGDTITAACGAQLKDISMKALENDLTGLEFACGIPGSLGGAVFMNAGAYLGEMKHILEEVTVLDTDGEILVLEKDDLDLSYRSSAVKKKGYLVLEAKMKLKKGDHLKIKERMDDLTKKREDKQPLEMPSAGSTFKRPEGHFAGKLIEDAGLKGYSHNGAQVSSKHSGFIINRDNAKASDVIELIQHVQKTIKDRYGVDLETEVLIVGEEE